MQANARFEKEVAAGKPTGVVSALDRFLVTVKGLRGVTIGSLVLFETGQKGMVREVSGGHVTVLNIDRNSPSIGGLAVVAERELGIPVGEKGGGNKQRLHSR